MADSWDYASVDRSREEAEVSTPLPAFLRDPLGILRRRWVWMLLSFVLSFGAVGGFVLTRAPSYVAETTILVSSQEIPEDFVRTTVVEDSLQRINAIVGLALSRHNLAGLVEKYGVFPELREEEPMAAVVGKMRRGIEIYPQQSLARTRGSPTSQVFVISFEYPEPQVAADITNEIAGFFTAANIAMRNRQAQLTTDFLRRELHRSDAELREHEHEISEFMRQHRGGLPGELDTNLAKLERLQAQRQSLASQIDSSEGRLMLLGQQPESTAGDGPTPRSLLGDLRLRLEEELVILTEEHPNVIALRRRIERLEAEIVEEQQTGAPTQRDLAMASEQHQLERLRAQQVAIEEAILELDAQVDATPRRREEFSALERRATVLRENYLGFLRKVQEAELAQSLESAQHGARISVLDRATPPAARMLHRWRLLAAGLVAAVGLSLAVAVVLELIDSVVVSVAHLETLSNKPVLGSIPRVV